MSWFLYDRGPRHERVKGYQTLMKPELWKQRERIFLKFSMNVLKNSTCLTSLHKKMKFFH